MVVIGLRGVKNEFAKTSRGNRKEVFHCEETNNTLVFNPLDTSCDRRSIINGIMDDRYLPLIESLNTEKNIVVYWSQVKGTTSDYTVYKNVHLSGEELKSFRKASKHLKGLIKEMPDNRWKYNIVENGILSKLLFD